MTQLDAYLSEAARLGQQAARAWRHGEESLARFNSQHARKMARLVDQEDRAAVTAAFDNAYRQEWDDSRLPLGNC